MIFLPESYILVIQTAVLCRNCRTLLFYRFFLYIIRQVPFGICFLIIFRAIRPGQNSLICKAVKIFVQIGQISI